MAKHLTHREVVRALEELAPARLAEEWDNTGLLVDPGRSLPVRRLLLTVDLTEAVVAEAVSEKADMIVAYHPPLFHGLRRLAWGEPVQRAVMVAIRHSLPIWSPHTRLDAVSGGVGDWLADCLGEGTVTPIQPAAHSGGYKLVTFVPAAAAAGLRQALAKAGAGVIGDYTHCSFNMEGRGTFRGGAGSAPVVGRKERLEEVEEVRLEMVCPAGLCAELPALIAANHPYEEPAWDLYPLASLPSVDTGVGRCLVLDKPATLATLVRRLKRMLEIPRVRTALPPGAKASDRITRIALCPGAGGSLFRDLEGYHLYLTGEMGHHEILAKVGQGAVVLLCGHTETERGYLPILGEMLTRQLDDRLEVLTAEFDLPPLG